jgi:phage replication-related protein YjqB (UPF0714/DUF867 family)
VSRLLRHANPRVTTTVYGGINDGAARAIGSKLTNAGFRTTEGAFKAPSRFGSNSGLAAMGGTGLEAVASTFHARSI